MDIIIIIDGSNDNYDCNDPNITINNNNIYNYNNNSKNVRRLGLGRVQELQLVLLTKKFVVLADPPSIPGPFAEALLSKHRRVIQCGSLNLLIHLHHVIHFPSVSIFIRLPDPPVLSWSMKTFP